MKKIVKQAAALLLAAMMIVPSNAVAFAAENTAADSKEETAKTMSETESSESGTESGTESPDSKTGGNADAQSNSEAAAESGNGETAGNTDVQSNSETPAESGDGKTAGENADSQTLKNEDVTGEVKDNGSEDKSESSSETNITGTVILDENNDNVEIKKNDKPYLALGSDLSEQQRNTVFSLMGINAENLGNYDVVYITNEQEHQYLDAYMDKSKIGTRSLSSVVIVQREKGNGLNISTNNITYCTVGMYKNALTTAGITDADIIVAGPTPISGTAALVGIFKAYEQMTGNRVQENVVDAALNELVITGQLEDSIEGLTNEEVEEFIAYVKSLIAENNLTDEAGINDAIDDACEKYGVTLTEDERQMIVELLLKISALGIDLSGLVDYASSLYDSFKNGGDSSGLIAKIGNFIGNIFSAIGQFFKNLFQ